MKRRTLHNPLRSLFRVTLVTLALAVLLGTAGTAWLANQVHSDIDASLPQVDDLSAQPAPRITRVTSDDGHLIATLYKQNQKPIAFEKMGDNIVDAIISIEDARFFSHRGVDYQGIARAALANFRAGGVEQGASTITMQLARKLYLTNERSLERKVKEVLLAQKLEKKAGKTAILTRYLNDCYFGSGAYGIAAAANRYYQTTPDKLSIAQAALLAGLVQAPTSLSPEVDSRAAKHRQLLVLVRMRELGNITPKQYLSARKEALAADFSKLAKQPVEPLLKYPYFTTYALRHLPAGLTEEQVYDQGLRITTTLDIKAQRLAESVVQDAINRQGRALGIHSAAVVLIENSTGHVKAMVGGSQWQRGDRFNRAWQAKRQPGSTFKPFLYSTALESGFDEETIVSDKKISLVVDAQPGTPTTVWSPLNSDGRSLGNIPLREALRLSRNQAAADIVSQVGVGHVIDVARRVGIESNIPRVPSIALGSLEVSPLEMASAYSVFPNAGQRIETSAITTITDHDGRPLANTGHSWSRQAVSQRVATEMTDMLMRVVRSGTGYNAQMPDVMVAGKTGTTDNFKDAWFVGYTPKYTMAVWMGNDSGQPTHHVYGGDLPAQTWRRIMAGLDQGPERSFAFLNSRPESLKLCKVTHGKATPDCTKTYRETFFLPEHRVDDCQPCHRVAEVRRQKIAAQKQKVVKSKSVAPVSDVPTVPTAPVAEPETVDADSQVSEENQDLVADVDLLNDQEIPESNLSSASHFDPETDLVDQESSYPKAL